MYSMRKRIPLAVLLVILLTGLTFQAALAEDQPQPDAYTQSEAANAELVVQPEAMLAVEPAAEHEAGAAAEPVIQLEAAATAASEPTVIPENRIPLAGGQEPSVTVLANRSIEGLNIGDRLVLTCKLNGFDGMDCQVRWQALANGSWKDLKGEHFNTLTVEITGDNAGWAYRAAVDAEPLYRN